MRNLRLLTCLCLLFLVGCTARQMPGFKETFVTHTVSDGQLAEITRQFQRRNLVGAAVTRDLVGRVRLVGSYRTDDDVDMAYLIVQGVVGMKATSPFYPENVQRTRWAEAMARAMEEASRPRPPRPPQKLALVIGISQFKQSPQIPAILGEEDADTAAQALRKYGYQVTLLKGRAATHDAIVGALNKLKEQVGPQDQLFIFISSHGTPPLRVGNAIPNLSSDYKMSIVAYDSEVRDGALLDAPDGTLPWEQEDAYHDARIRLYQTSVPDFLLREVLAKPTAGTRLLLDICYGGNMLAGTPDPYVGQRGGDGTTGEVSSIRPDSMMNSPAAPSAIQAKGIRQVGGGNQPAHATPSAPSTLLTAQAPPRTVITAADAGQQSFGPRTVEDNGTFTHPANPTLRFKGSFFTQMFFDELGRQNGALRPSFQDSQKATLLLHEKLQRRANQVPSIRQNPQMRTNEAEGLSLLK